MSSKQRLSILVLATAFGPALAAAEWPHWRGPNYNGSTTAKDLPVRFGPTENVRWKAVLPGPCRRLRNLFAILWTDSNYPGS